MGEQAESVGIALKMGNIVPESRRNLRFQRAAHTFRKESLYGFLATMSEGWVSQVMSQTGSADDLSDLNDIPTLATSNE